MFSPGGVNLFSGGKGKQYGFSFVFLPLIVQRAPMSYAR
jgi:hypothetical protein